MRYGILVAMVVACALAMAAHAQETAQPWTVELVKTVSGLQVPECVHAHPGREMVFVSNIEAVPDEYWSDDGKGFITVLTPTGDVTELRWVDSKPGAVLNAPKGMCVLKDYLFIADNTRLLRVPVDGKAPMAEVPLPETEKLNDLATDGEFVYVSDIGLNRIYKVGLNGGQTILKAPNGINGVTCYDGRLFGVSWYDHEVYEIDLSGDKDPVPFGLADHFTTLDGIEILNDGTFIVSSFEGNMLWAITPDRKTVTSLIEVETPADIGFDRVRGLLYAPLFMKNEVAILKLKRR
ncbi:MAG: hypothetical protein GY851_18980 [bacterium]|nr:hypothetical protein [bacterium]